MFEKLQADYQRFLEIEQMLLDPTVIVDAAQVIALGRGTGHAGEGRDPLWPLPRAEPAGRRGRAARRQRGRRRDAFLCRGRARRRSARATSKRERSCATCSTTAKPGAGHAALIVEIRAGTGGERGRLVRSRPLRNVPAVRRANELEIRAPRPRRQPSWAASAKCRSASPARARFGTSSSKAASTAFSACPKPKPRAGSTRRPRRSPSCPSPRTSIS